LLRHSRPRLKIEKTLSCVRVFWFFHTLQKKKNSVSNIYKITWVVISQVHVHGSSNGCGKFFFVSYFFESQRHIFTRNTIFVSLKKLWGAERSLALELYWPEFKGYILEEDYSETEFPKCDICNFKKGSRSERSLDWKYIGRNFGSVAQ